LSTSFILIQCTRKTFNQNVISNKCTVLIGRFWNIYEYKTRTRKFYDREARWLIDDIFCSFELWWVKASACTRQWEWLILSYRINSLQIDVYIYWHSLDWSCRLSYPRNPYAGLFIMVWHQYKPQRTPSFWFFICLFYFKLLDFFSYISALLLLSMKMNLQKDFYTIPKFSI
jgi:hypothetical protein